MINSTELYNVVYDNEKDRLSYPDWIYPTSYWTGFSLGFFSDFSEYPFGVYFNGDNTINDSERIDGFGVRPVVIIPISELSK